jgi:hypothetical protein
MSYIWWFLFLIIPFVFFASLVRLHFDSKEHANQIQIFQAANMRRRRKLLQYIPPMPVMNNPVVYTVPAQVHIQPVHNNFPNTRHVGTSTLVAEQRLNQHYAHQQYQQPPPYFDTNQQQRY